MVANIDITTLVKRQKVRFQDNIRHTTAGQRIDQLNRLKKWILAHQDDIRKAVFEDFKKPSAEVDLFDIKIPLGEIEEAKAHLHQWMQEKVVKGNTLYMGSSAKIIYEPKGVVLIISPWNFPFMLAISPLVSAIAAGCCAVIKPTELAPVTAALIAKMAQDVFVEEEVAVCLGGADVAKELLKQPFDHIFFTGSPAIGKIVMRAAAEHLASVTLELGGLNPVIVDESADIRDTAEKLVWGKFINNGQSCVAPNYVCVHHSVERRLLREMKTALERFYGKASEMEHNKDICRIINADHFLRIHTLLEDSLLAGANLAFGGVTNPEDNYLAPTIITDTPDDAPVMHEEIFGPILPIRTYTKLEEVIQLINSKPKPLALYIFSVSKKTPNDIIAKTSAGTTCINDIAVQFAHPNLPFGGVNGSGLGKAHGYYGFMAFTNERSIVHQRRGMTSFKLVYPPYTDKVKRTIQLVMRYF